MNSCFQPVEIFLLSLLLLSIHSEYKGDRKPIEDALRWQLTQLADVTHAMGIKTISAPGFEADDVIGSLARLGSECTDEPFDRIIILSNDKDFVQCLTSKVSMLSPKSGMGTNYVFTHASDAVSVFGVDVDRFVDYLMLLGDVVDGIPGVESVGEKNAQALLRQFASVEEVMEAIRGNKKLPVRAAKKVAANLVKAEKHFKLWRQLATIRTDVPSLLTEGGDAANLSSWDSLRYRGPVLEHASSAPPSPPMERVLALYRKLNFPPPPAYFFQPTAPTSSSSPVTPSSLSLSSSSSFSLDPMQTGSLIRLLTHTEWNELTEKRLLKKTMKAKLDLSTPTSSLSIESSSSVTLHASTNKTTVTRTRKSTATTKTERARVYKSDTDDADNQDQSFIPPSTSKKSTKDQEAASAAVTSE